MKTHLNMKYAVYETSINGHTEWFSSPVSSVSLNEHGQKIEEDGAVTSKYSIEFNTSREAEDYCFDCMTGNY